MNEIYGYICESLDNNIDDFVFDANTIEELGKLYFGKIVSSNPAFTAERVRATIEFFSHREEPLHSEADYYIALCDYIGIKLLPRNVRSSVEAEYNKILNLKYTAVISQYEKAVKQLDREDGGVDQSISRLFTNRSSLPLDYDLTEDEVQLTQLYHKKDEIRSRKDSLEFAKASADSFLKRFCDFDDPSSVEIAIRRTALSICKYPRDNIRDNISSVFQPYSMILEVLEDDINRPYALFFKVKLYYIREIASRNYYIQEAAMGSETAEKNLGQYLSKLPSIDTLHEEKENKQDQYLASLQALMNDYDLVSQMKKMLSESACLQKRKSILERIIQLFESSESLLVCSLLPTQIEGVFNDLLFDATTFSRFSDFNIFPKEVLKV